MTHFYALKKQEFDHIFKVFNEYDRNLKFIHEIESNEKIIFLEVNIRRTNNVISTNCYQKSIASDRVLLFTSNHTYLSTKKNYGL